MNGFKDLNTTGATDERCLILQRIMVLLKDTLSAWQQDKGSRLAAALAYYTVFSITPLLIIIISITGLVFGERAARDEIAYQLEGLVGSEAAAMVQTMLANFENPASGIFTSIIGLGTMVYGATGLFYHVQGALNTIWHVETTAVNGFVYQVKQRFIHLAIIFGVGAFLLLLIFTEFVFTAITEYLNMENSPQITNFILYLVMVAVLFAVLYKILPEVKTAWRDVFLGAAVTSLLFNVGRTLIGFYMRLSNVGSAYGTAGSLVILLVWVYYSAQIFLLGAEFTHAYAHTFGSHVLTDPLHNKGSIPEDKHSQKTLVSVDLHDNSNPLAIQNMAVEETTHVLNMQDRVEDTDLDMPPVSVKPQRLKLTKKMITMTTIIGTLSASALSLSWLHRKRKKTTHNDNSGNLQTKN